MEHSLTYNVSVADLVPFFLFANISIQRYKNALPWLGVDRPATMPSTGGILRQKDIPRTESPYRAVPYLNVNPTT